MSLARSEASYFGDDAWLGARGRPPVLAGAFAFEVAAGRRERPVAFKAGTLRAKLRARAKAAQWRALARKKTE